MLRCFDQIVRTKAPVLHGGWAAVFAALDVAAADPQPAAGAGPAALSGGTALTVMLSGVETGVKVKIDRVLLILWNSSIPNTTSTPPTTSKPITTPAREAVLQAATPQLGLVTVGGGFMGGGDAASCGAISQVRQTPTVTHPCQ